ncbi:uncharacterized protein LOC133358560 [Lethenteron reissneri]|uniref:uncharacterized protein LOC133358560 n=1 Tax=Lethenteron reissneri TaxID=7753 RepID=UPI002AB7F210|nr:uncharacterized protein LOC133358560 [Lethenteron reissneri]
MGGPLLLTLLLPLLLCLAAFAAPPGHSLDELQPSGAIWSWEGDSVLLDANFESGGILSSLRWTFNGSVVVVNGSEVAERYRGRARLEANGSLWLQRVALGDSGVYRLHAEDDGSPASAQGAVELIVYQIDDPHGSVNKSRASVRGISPRKGSVSNTVGAIGDVTAAGISSGLSAGAIAGIVVGIVVLSVLLSLIGYGCSDKSG